jgi:hypothetical protein
MILHGKYFGSLFIALYLLSLANLALANLDPHDNRLSESGCVSIATNFTNPTQNHSNCATEDTEMSNVDSFDLCHLPSISFSCPFVPLDASLDITETHKELPRTYASIFVPPQ